MFATLASKLLPFAARFLVTILLLLVAWPYVSPTYARAMAAAGGAVLRTVSVLSPDSRLEARDRRIWVFRPVAKIDGSRAMAGVNVLDDATYFNLLLLASLIAATPSLAWAARVKALCFGGGLLSLLHLADLYVKLKWTGIHPALRLQGIVPDAASPVTLALFEWLYAFFSVIGFGLFPILVWLGVVALWWPRGEGGQGSTPERTRARAEPAQRRKKR